jgi:raffinose/stachyose/melibiose transport system permease protein
MRMKKTLIAIIKNVTAWIVTLIVIIPAVVVLINSFKSRAEAYTLTLELPKKLMLENFLIVIDKGKLIMSFFNSMLYSTLSVAIVVFVTTLAAFVMSRNQTRLNRFFYYFIVLGIAMPVNYIALMKVMKYTHLINTRIGMVLLYAAFSIPISLFIAYGFIGTIPKEMDEAAIIDGCGPFGLYFKVIVPLLKPVIATLFVLNFMGCWNDFIMPLYYLNSSSKWPMTLAVYNFFGMYMMQWNLVCADIVLTSLPVLAVFIIGQKYIVSGMMSGAVKG